MWPVQWMNYIGKKLVGPSYYSLRTYWPIFPHYIYTSKNGILFLVGAGVVRHCSNSCRESLLRYADTKWAAIMNTFCWNLEINLHNQHRYSHTTMSQFLRKPTCSCLRLGAGLNTISHLDLSQCFILYSRLFWTERYKSEIFKDSRL